MTSGSVLREARERQGFQLDTVARRLRIRPDILRAIEASDFSAMPPRGYARNMVNAYARLLGLNPTEIVNMYLDEAYAYQIERARGAGPGSGFVMGGERRPRLGLRGASREGASDSGSSRRSKDRITMSDDTYSERRTYGNGSRPRRLYDDRTAFSRDDYGITRQRADRSDRSDRDFLSHHSGYATPGYSTPDERKSRSRGKDIHVGQTPMQYSAPRLPAALRSRPVVIAGIALIILAILAVFFFVTNNSGHSEEDDVSTLPVSGISDTTGTSDDEEAAIVEIAPTSAHVVYSVDAGDACYIETTTDGQNGAEMLEGPMEKSLEITGTWSIATWSPDTIKVTVNGEKVELAIGEDYNGMYGYTVDFEKLLADWKSTHTSKSSQRQAAVAEATSAANQSQSSSSSSSGDSSESGQA